MRKERGKGEGGVKEVMVRNDFGRKVRDEVKECSFVVNEDEFMREECLRG